MGAVAHFQVSVIRYYYIKTVFRGISTHYKLLLYVEITFHRWATLWLCFSAEKFSLNLTQITNFIGVMLNMIESLMVLLQDKPWAEVDSAHALSWTKFITTVWVQQMWVQMIAQTWFPTFACISEILIFQIFHHCQTQEQLECVFAS